MNNTFCTNKILFLILYTIFLCSCNNNTSNIDDNIRSDSSGLGQEQALLNATANTSLLFNEIDSLQKINSKDKSNKLNTNFLTNKIGKMVTVYYGEPNVNSIHVSYSNLKEAIKANAKATCAIIPRSQLVYNSTDDSYTYNATTLGERKVIKFNRPYFLCQNEEFRDEIVPSNCTAWGWKGDRIVTAKHCISTKQDALKYYFVFDFLELKNVKISSNKVYEGIDVISPLKEDENEDFRIVVLNKVLPQSRQMPKIANEFTQELNTEIYMLGHPLGLPMKLIDSAKVAAFKPPQYYTNLDAFNGNSGSPVFNAKTHELIGILLKGKGDFIVNHKEKCVMVNSYENGDVSISSGECVRQVKNLLNKY